MLTEVQLDEIVKRSFHNFTKTPVSDALRKRGAKYAYRGTIHIAASAINCVLGLPQKFPLRKPLFFIEPFDTLGFIPHVEPDGFICFIQDQNLILDHNNPEEVLKQCFQKIQNVLTRGANGKNLQDFLMEFETYWNRSSPESPVYKSFISQGDEPKRVFVGINQGIRIIAEGKSEIITLCTRFKLKRSGRVVSGVYIPIKQDLVDKPPKYDNFWSASYIKSIVKKSVTSSILSDIVSNYTNKDDYVLLGIPDSSGVRHLAGIKFRKKKKNQLHPLIDVANECYLTPFSIDRIDETVIIPRGGGNSNLFDKKVLLVGCGSLGSCISINLAKSGFGRLTLLDPQTLRMENIHRHVLGLPYIGKNKAKGLKEFIENQLPSIKIDAVSGYIENQDLATFERFDIVIFATGEPTINLYLNERIRKEMLSVKTVFTWLEPYGIGGHVLFSTPHLRGCYRCLYGEDLYNRASFCSKDQPRSFTKSVSGCSGLFVPFSFADATRSAEMTTRVVSKALQADDFEPQILSWKGDPFQFLKEGFNLSERFLAQNEVELFENRKKFIQEQCLDC